MSPVPFVAWRSDLDRARRMTADLSEQLSRKDAALVQAQEELAAEEAITAELSDAYLATYAELADANAKVAAMAARDRQPRPGPLRGPGGRFTSRTLAESTPIHDAVARALAAPQTTPPPMTGVPAGGVPPTGPATAAGPVDTHYSDVEMARDEAQRYANWRATAAEAATEAAPHDRAMWIRTYVEFLDEQSLLAGYFVIEDFDFAAEMGWDEYRAGLDVPDDIDDHPDDRA